MTFVDGLVVARFHLQHRYQLPLRRRHRDASEVKDLEEKRVGLEALVEHIIPGRTQHARPPTEKELRSTMLLKLPLTESSAKIRTGWPADEEEDYDLSIWAGSSPLRTAYSRPGPTRPCASNSALPTTWRTTNVPAAQQKPRSRPDGNCRP